MQEEKLRLMVKGSRFLHRQATRGRANDETR